MKLNLEKPYIYIPVISTYGFEIVTHQPGSIRPTRYRIRTHHLIWGHETHTCSFAPKGQDQDPSLLIKCKRGPTMFNIP